MCINHLVITWFLNGHPSFCTTLLLRGAPVSPRWWTALLMLWSRSRLAASYDRDETIRFWSVTSDHGEKKCIQVKKPVSCSFFLGEEYDPSVLVLATLSRIYSSSVFTTLGTHNLSAGGPSFPRLSFSHVHLFSSVMFNALQQLQG
ncbi:hypothetical protein JB92DRAFT_457292 [Gautieria morchelliformis]|nr:hypothetical protein JB92DRAFT_457292 [Gautieria morchelliformis]